MFVNENYNNYKYLVNVSDNYVVLSNVSSINGSFEDPDSISVIYQYFYPSTQVITGTYTSYNSQTFTNVQSQISNDFYDRPDASNIIFTGGLFLFCAIYIISLITTLVHKGGILYD